MKRVSDNKQTPQYRTYQSSSSPGLANQTKDPNQAKALRIIESGTRAPTKSNTSSEKMPLLNKSQIIGSSKTGYRASMEGKK